MVRASQFGASVKCRKRPLTVAKRPAGVSTRRRPARSELSGAFSSFMMIGDEQEPGTGRHNHRHKRQRVRLCLKVCGAPSRSVPIPGKPEHAFIAKRNGLPRRGGGQRLY
jgi:hypothetical protein